MRKLIAALATIAVLPSFAAKVGYSTLISHRGESHDAPENTLPAFKMAVERGFGFECDVYLSKDKKVFTFHDRNLKRTTGGANSKACSDVTWEEISKLDVGGWGKWKGSKYVGTRPALLEEVLDLARDGRQIYVEIKTGPEIVPYIKEVFAKQNRATPKNTLFISFNAESCKEVKKLMPEYKVYYLTVAYQKNAKSAGGKKVSVTAAGVVEKLKSIGADGVDIQFKKDIITKEFIDAVHAAGYEVHVWTVDNLEDTVEAFSRGAATVTTNCAKKQYEQWKSR